MNTPIRQHTIPQMLQRRFADDEGILYFVDKRDRSQCVRATSPKNIFVEKNVYSAIKNDSSKDTSLETRYSLIEGKANGVVEKIVQAARASSPPKLTPSEKSDFDEFVHSLWKRTPDFFRTAWSEADTDRSIKSTLDQIERENGEMAPELAAALADPNLRARLQHNARVGALGDPGPFLANALAGRGLIVARIELDAQSFLLGSLPIVDMPRLGFAEHLTAGSEIWIALSWDTAISYAAAPGRELFVPISEERRLRALIRSRSNKARSSRVGPAR